MASSSSSATSASARRPTFWGKIVTAEKPYHLHVNNVFTLRLTQAALDPISSCSTTTTTTPTSLLCKIGDKPPVIVCTLRFESKENCLLNMEYGGPSNVFFSLQGPGPIHISGYYFCDPPPPPSFPVLSTSPTNEGGAVVPISERGAASQLQNEQDKWYRLLGMTVASQYINHSARSRRASGLLGGPNLDGANACVSIIGARQHPAITFQTENEIEKPPDQICNDEAAEKVDIVDVQTHDSETERAATESAKVQIADAVVCDDNAVLTSVACSRQDSDGHADISPLVSVAELPNTLSADNSSIQRGDSVVHDSAVRRKLDYKLPNGQSTMSKGKEVVSDVVEKGAELLNANQDVGNEKISYEGLGVDPNNSTRMCVGPLEQLEVTVQSPISAEEVTVGAEVNHLDNLLEDNTCSRNAEKIVIDGDNILVEKIRSQSSAEEIAVGDEVNLLDNRLVDNTCTRYVEKIAIDGEEVNSNILVEQNRSQGPVEKISIDGEANHPNVLVDETRSQGPVEKKAIDGETHLSTIVEENRIQGNPEDIATQGEHHPNILDEARRGQRSLRRRNNRKTDGVGDAGLNDTPSDIDGHLSVPNNTHENVDNTAEDVHLKDKNEGSKGLKHSKKDKSRKRKPDATGDGNARNSDDLAKGIDSLGSKGLKLSKKDKSKKRKPDATGDENARNSDDLSKGIDSLRDDSLEPKDTGASAGTEFVVEKELKPKRKRKRSRKSSSTAHNADEVDNHATKVSELIQYVEPGSTLERSMDPSDLQDLGHIKKKKKKSRKVEGYGVETEDATFSSMVAHHLHESGPIKQKKKKEKIEESGVKTEAETGRILGSMDSSDQQEYGQIKKKKMKKEKVKEPGVETADQTVRSTDASDHQESVQVKKKKAKKEKVQASAVETEEQESVQIKKKAAKKEKVQAAPGAETKEQTVRSMGPSDQQESVQITEEKMKKEKVLKSDVETKDQTARDRASKPLSEEHQVRLVGGTSRDFVLALAAVVKP